MKFEEPNDRGDNQENQTPIDFEAMFSNTPQKKKTISTELFVGILCIVIAASIILTSLITSSILRRKYINEIAALNYQVNVYQDTLGDNENASIGLLVAILEKYSYYEEDLTWEEKVNRVLADYRERTGDLYAQFYTQEEYESLFAVTEYQGIGITTYQGQLQIGDITYDGYVIDDYFEGAPAAEAGIQRWDFIYEIKVDGVFRSVTDLGVSSALSYLSGEAGKTVEFRVFRSNGADTFETVEFQITCQKIEVKTVHGYLKEGSNDTAVVRIDQFDVQTPEEFKEIVSGFIKNGVKKFVFDVRNNPGGDVQSVKAILSFFLKKGDLIMTAQKMDLSDSITYSVEPMNYAGDYRGCNVKESEIGMFADLDAVVLCNENTASAAEVFTATFRDYGLAPTVGVKTFGKGIMQTVFNLSAWGNYSGYIKLTTYAYVTKCGVSYHGLGITPDHTKEQSAEALAYHYKDVPQALDDQLNAAFDLLAS